jgi:4-amino-4-deoxy-L-arabinose transferase-like glycosyltransferase
MDFPGGIFFLALSLLTGLGPALYALAAAVAGLAVVGAARRFASLPAALAAGVIWLCSPMVFSLSLTTHNQAVSRLFLALAMYLAARALAPRPGERPLRAAFGLGLCAGGAFLSRPIEIGMLLLPLAVWLVARAVRGGAEERRMLVMAAAGVVPALILFGCYNRVITGHFLVQARFAAEARSNEGAVLTFWQRLPVHFCFETLMLAVWFLGPIGVALAALGTQRKQPISVALAVGLFLDLSITLTHQFTGVHVVGPIHFSETPVFLTLLAALGLDRLFAGLRARGIPGAPAAWVLLGTVLLGYGAFDALHGRTLHAQAEAQQYPLDELARRDIHHAVVVADTLALLYQRHPTGSWVQQFPHPDPYLRDDIIFARAGADLPALRARFPDRRFYRLRIAKTGPAITIDPL